MGPRRASSGRDQGLARGDRPLAAAGQGCAGRRRLGPHGSGARPADAGGRRRARGVEPAGGNERAQSLARRRGRLASAAGGLGAAHPARLRHPAEEPATELRAVHEPRRRRAGRLPALPRQQPARELRPARHADPAHAAGEEESLREAMTESEPTAPPRAAFVFLFITVLLDMLALGVVVPVLPKLVVDFLAGDTARAAEIYGLFGAAWALMQFLISPLHGALSDRFGRRPLILISNFGLGLDYILMALAPNLWWLFVGRVISGITAASVATSYAYVADVTAPALRSARFGMLGVAFG